MKKLILSLVTMASLAFAANAVTYMRVHTSDGQVVKYDVETVTEVDYEESTETPNQVVDGVTVSGKEGLYTYVDLGLPSGTKWATYNVGASRPTAYGYYFAWGETKQRKDYESNTYKWFETVEENLGGFVDVRENVTKYCNRSNFGIVDHKRVLESEDDAATANWGSGWRMPTWEEIEELRAGCDWEWTNNFDGMGVAGEIGTSITNGNIIFLPAAGYRDGTDLNKAGDEGYFWSSSLSAYDSHGADYLEFCNGSYCGGGFYGDRYAGLSVRAVVKGKTHIVSFYTRDSILIEK